MTIRRRSRVDGIEPSRSPAVKPGDEAELTAMIHELAEFERAAPSAP